MRRSCRALLQALEQELILGRQLLKLANALTEALRENDTARMEALEPEGAELVARQQAQEKMRVAAALSLSREVGLLSGEQTTLPTLAQIARCLSAAEARRLLQLRSRLIALDREIQAVHKRNRALIENALEVSQVFMDALTRFALRPAPYGTNPNALLTPTFYLDRRV